MGWAVRLVGWWDIEKVRRSVEWVLSAPFWFASAWFGQVGPVTSFCLGRLEIISIHIYALYGWSTGRRDDSGWKQRMPGVEGKAEKYIWVHAPREFHPDTKISATTAANNVNGNLVMVTLVVGGKRGKCRRRWNFSRICKRYYVFIRVCARVCAHIFDAVIFFFLNAVLRCDKFEWKLAYACVWIGGFKSRL